MTHFLARLPAVLARIAGLAIVAACLTIAPGQAQGDADDRVVHVYYVPSGQSITIPTANVTRIAIGDSSIAGVVMAGTDQIVVNGKGAGRTTLMVWHGAAMVSYAVVVTAQSLEDFARVVRGAINEPHVTVSTARNAIFVSGAVADGARFLAVEDVVDRFALLAKNEHFTIVNAVTVADGTSPVQRQLAQVPGLQDVVAAPDGKGNLVVSGTVADRKTEEQAIEKARGLAGGSLAADGKVVDRIATTHSTQIGVKVYILEIDDTGLSQLGLSIQGANPDPNNPGTFTLGQPSFVGVETRSTGIGLGAFARITRLAPTLDLIITSGHAKILSAPNLVTTPGNAAKFLVGGEIPYVVSTGLGQSSITFKEYGVKLDMTPHMMGNGDIETLIEPEVSQLDYQDGVTLNGFVVPAFKTSKLSTDIITQPGESVVMGGLLSRVEQRTIAKIPVLGDLPVLGQLFRSTRYQTSQTDVVFVMTPDAIVR